MSIIKVNNNNFSQEVLQSDQPVLVDFYADWCGPCKMVAPILDQIAAENSIKIAKLNIDENQELAGTYKVMTIPTLAVFVDGQVKKTTIGVKSKEEILEFVNEA